MKDENFERTKDVHFKSHADWESIQRPKRYRVLDYIISECNKK